MAYVVLTVMGTVPVMASVANRAAYTAASCFSVREYRASAPLHIGTRNPRVDVAVLIAATDPFKTSLGHMHI